MLAYGYEVEGSPAVLADISKVIASENWHINWNRFNNGDIYWTEKGDGHYVTINHETKQVTLEEII